MKINYFLASLVFIYGVNMVFGQAHSSLTELAKKNRHWITHKGNFSGPGWEYIKDAAVSNKYFLIGEDHGFVEIPLFIKELNKSVSFDLLVAEIDSTTASAAKNIATEDNQTIALFHERYPSALSFYSAKEEFELIREMVQNGADVWGLDQISFFSTGIAFKELNKITKSNKAKDLTEKLVILSNDNYKETVDTGNFERLFLLSSKQGVFDSLNSAFLNEVPKAKSLLKEIELSWQIYNNLNGFNHSTRIKAMKSKLLSYYTAQLIGKKAYNNILYKFGANHVARGLSPINGYDIGNFVSNLADAEGSSSYHLMIIGKRGVQNTFFPSKGLESMSFDSSDMDSELESLVPFTKLISDNRWGFFDLSEIKLKINQEKLRVDDRFLKAVLLGYDGLLIIPEVSPSTIIGTDE